MKTHLDSAPGPTGRRGELMGSGKNLLVSRAGGVGFRSPLVAADGRITHATSGTGTSAS